MKILRSKKALSPVVASIILIAVTVAVSIAVAAWMGALSVGFMGSSSITITEATFSGTDQVTLELKNTGTKSVTIVAVKVNGANLETAPSFDPDSTVEPATTASVTITLNDDWVEGNPYKFDLYDGSGQIVGSYQATAPS